MRKEKVKIYNKDGSMREIEGSVITISADTVKSLENQGEGVMVYFKDGRNHFIENAHYDTFTGLTIMRF